MDIKEKIKSLYAHYSNQNYDVEEYFNTESFLNFTKIRFSLGEKDSYHFEQYKNLLKESRRGFPDARYEIEDLIYDGNTKVVVRGKFIGTYKNAITFKKATNEIVEFEFAHIYEINKETTKIEKMFSISDELTLFLSIGFVVYDMGSKSEDTSDIKVENTFPTKISELSKEWLHKALVHNGVLTEDVLIESFNVDANVGENQQGYAGKTVRLEIKFSKETKANNQYIIKFSSENQIFRSVFSSMGFYHKEVKIYQLFGSTHLQQNFPVRIPVSYWAEINDKSGEHVIFMQDLKEIGMNVGDSVVGATYEQVKKVISYMTKLHSHFWDNKAEEFDWLVKMQSKSTFASATYNINKEKFFNNFSGSIPVELGQKIKDYNPEKYTNMLKERNTHKTLNHGDSHINNMLFSDNEVIFVDWQLIQYSVGVRDLIYFLFFSVTPEFTNEHFDDLKSLYFEELMKNAKENTSLKNYTRELFEEDVIFAVNLVTEFIVILGGSQTPSDIKEKDQKVERGKELITGAIKRFINLSIKIGVEKLFN